MDRPAWLSIMLLSTLLSIPLRAGVPQTAPAPARLTFCCSADNDLYAALHAAGHAFPRFDTAPEAARAAEAGTALLILAEHYPDAPTPVDDAVIKLARSKHLRLYVEYPASWPGMKFAAPRGTNWQRLVVASDALGKSLPKMRILAQQDCHFIPVDSAAQDVGPISTWLVVARVAGYDTAVFGLPDERWPILVELPADRALLATTKLSHFVTGRFAPRAEWRALWRSILHWLDPSAGEIELIWSPAVGYAHASGDAIGPAEERAALERAGEWLVNSKLLVSDDRAGAVHQGLLGTAEVAPPPGDDAPAGDGSHGILEGYSSAIRCDGTQLQRQPIRADCQAESAMVLALAGALRGDDRQSAIATRLLDFLYFTSDMQRNGPRGEPKHPSYGLIAWGSTSPAWLVANYGDDNARTILATLAASAALKSDRWDEPALAALLANLRTTGTNGFRGDRIDQPQLEQLGWKHFHDAATINPAPHFEAYLWACYLWAYHQTGEAEFLQRTKTAIAMTMDAYAKKGWRWNDNIERARMLLPLAWLVRVEDTPEHRRWLKTIADDLLSAQVPCGAIQERLGGEGGGHFRIPQSNEAYGTGETPLIQEVGDPVSDQLYTTGFALLALREASAAVDDAFLRDAENRLAAYLCRIQTRSTSHPELSGTWFRAFDYERWECYASSADVGWGAWSIEAGWAQAWTAAVLALRARQTTLWDFTAGSTIERHLADVRDKMSVNTGGPWRP